MSDPTGLITEANTPGTVVYGILGWRSDSIMLARLRPVFLDLIADALTHECEETWSDGGPCRVHARSTRGDWCAPCRLADIAERVEEVARA